MLLTEIPLLATLSAFPAGHPAVLYDTAGLVWNNAPYAALDAECRAQLQRTSTAYFHTSDTTSRSVVIPVRDGGALHASVQLQGKWVVIIGVVAPAVTTTTTTTTSMDFSSTLRGTPVGALILEHDWTATLGPIRQWPASLKTVVSLLLSDPTETCLFWGTERTLLYNDAWKNGFASATPHQLGQPGHVAFKETWDTFSQNCDMVDTGTSIMREDDLLFFDSQSGGELESHLETDVFSVDIPGRLLPSVFEAYYSWSYAPVLVEDGSIGGIMGRCTDTTAKVLLARRLRILRELGEKTGPANSLLQFWDGVERVLLPYPLDFPYVLFYKGISSTCDTDGDTPSTERSSRAGPLTHLKLVRTIGVERGHPVASPTFVKIFPDSQSTDAWPLSAACSRNAWLRAKNPYPSVFQRRGWGDPVGDAILVPLAIPDGGLLGVAVLGLNTRRPYDDHYLGFHQALVGNLSAALAATMAYETEAKQAQELRSLDRAKTVFFENVSHELRTPITLIRGPCQDALADLDLLDPNSRARFKLIHRASGRLLRLVNSLMMFASVEARRLQTAFRPVMLGPVTANLASLFRSAIEKAGIRYEVTCGDSADEPYLTYVDLGLWEQIVFNLLSNAVKYTKAGSINVTISYSATHAILRVEDTGCGIPQDQLEQIWTRFHRVDSSEGRSHEGTGIGLALTSELVKIHSGVIRVESTLHVGSAFIVELPLGYNHLPIGDVEHDLTQSIETGSYAAGIIEEASGWMCVDSDTSSDASSNASSDAPIAEKYTVLVVEDNVDARSYIKSILLTAVRDVVAVADGQAALDFIHKKALPDLIITDVMMPRMTGIQLITALENDPDLSVQSIPVIVLSAAAGSEGRSEDSLYRESIDFLSKPFTSGELINRVRTRLKGVKLQRQVRTQGVELRLTKRRYQRMSEMSPVAVFETDGTDSNVVAYANERFFMITDLPRVLPFAFDELVELLAPGSQAFVRQGWDDVSLEGKPIHFDFSFASGQNAFAEVKRLEDGTLLGTLTDQTEQRRFAADQLHSERAKADEAIHQRRLQEAFVDIVSHELRNPLSAIIQSADLLSEAIQRLQEILLVFKSENRDPDAEYLFHDGQEQIDDAKNAITSVTLCARHQSIIASDILAVSRLDSNLLALNIAPFYLLDEVDVTLRMYSVQASAQDINLKLTTSENIGPETCIVADPTRFSQVLVNLMANSFRILESWEGERRVNVDVSLQTKRPFGTSSSKKNDNDDASRLWLAVRLSDSGPGIPLDDQSSLFTRFNDVHSGDGMRRSSFLGGTGLGLYLCKKLTELQGGQIRHVTSPGDGASFWFFIEARAASPVGVHRAIPTLNRSIRTPSPHLRIRSGSPTPKGIASEGTSKSGFYKPQPVNNTAIPSSSRASLTILIVEDNLINQKLLNRQLQKAGFQTVTANNGLEALRYIESCLVNKDSKYPFVVLMDLEMPVMDGIDATMKIRELEAEAKLPAPRLPVFAITGNARQGQIDAALSAGMDTVFIKPYKIAEILEWLDRHGPR